MIQTALTMQLVVFVLGLVIPFSSFGSPNYRASLRSVMDRFEQKYDPFETRPPQHLSELCRRRHERGYFRERLTSEGNRLYFRNQGGLPNPLDWFRSPTGLCWWHSRFTRNALYLAVYHPWRGKPSAVYARELIWKIMRGSSVVSIPGYSSLYEFSADFKDEILEVQSSQQIDDIFPGIAAALEGAADDSPKKIERQLRELKRLVEDEDQVVYQAQNWEGIGSHSWLVTKVEDLPDGAGLRMTGYDSNSSRPKHISYRWGDHTFYYEDDYTEEGELRSYAKRFGLYIQRSDELERIQEILDSTCEKRAPRKRSSLGRMIENPENYSDHLLLENSYMLTEEDLREGGVPPELLAPLLARSKVTREAVFDRALADPNVDLFTAVTVFEEAIEIFETERLNPSNLSGIGGDEADDLLEELVAFHELDAVDLLLDMPAHPEYSSYTASQALKHLIDRKPEEVWARMRKHIRALETLDPESKEFKRKVDALGWLLFSRFGSSKEDRLNGLASRDSSIPHGLGRVMLSTSFVKNATQVLERGAPRTKAYVVRELSYKDEYRDYSSAENIPRLAELFLDFALNGDSSEIRTQALEAFSVIASGLQRIPDALWKSRKIRYNRAFAAALSRVEEIDERGLKYLKYHWRNGNPHELQMHVGIAKLRHQGLSKTDLKWLFQLTKITDSRKLDFAELARIPDEAFREVEWKWIDLLLTSGISWRYTASNRLAVRAFLAKMRLEKLKEFPISAEAGDRLDSLDYLASQPLSGWLKEIEDTTGYHP